MVINSLSDTQMLQQVPAGAKFEHYKGMRYEILAAGRHVESGELQVVYKALYHDEAFGDEAVWIRPLPIFLGKVSLDGKVIPRFRRVL